MFLEVDGVTVFNRRLKITTTRDASGGHKISVFQWLVVAFIWGGGRGGGQRRSQRLVIQRFMGWGEIVEFYTFIYNTQIIYLIVSFKSTEHF